MEIPNLVKLLLPLFFFTLTTSIAPIPSPSSPPEWDDNSDYPPPPPAAPCNSDDRNTLLQIKQALNNSDVFDSWIPDTDCCNGWDFLGCDSTTGHIKTFYFYGNTPWGRQVDLPTIFPSVIGNLSYLIDLFFKNNATGPIPSSLANLRRLSYLDLSDNRLSGPIPRFITGLQNLAYLTLDNNQLNGMIPKQLAQLTNLLVISLTNNKFSGHIPEGLFGQLYDPYNNGANLMIGSNNFTGSIPRSLAGIKFRRLELNNNGLEGDASFFFGKNKWLSYLDLSGNKLKFNMSNIEVNSGVITLLLNNNKIFGSLPASLVGVTMLSYFNVSNNRMCGRIPVGGRLQKFGASAYSGNECLCGTPLPPCT